jgi:hypothetical protein
MNLVINLEYVFHFTINKLSGYSIFNDLLNTIGMMILLVAMIFGIYVLHIIFREYRRKESINTLLFYFAGVCMLISGILITVVKLSYSTLGLYELGNILTCLAWTIVVVGMLFYDLFAFRNTYPERVKTLITIAVLISCFFTGILIFAIYSGFPYAYLNPNYFEYNYSPFIMVSIICSFVPLSMLGPLTFFYYAKKNREENKSKSNLSICFGIGIIFILIGLLNEIGFIYVFEFRVFFRIFLVAYISCSICICILPYFCKP